MATVTVTDPDYVTAKKVDDRGRVYVGRDYRGERVRVVLEALETEACEEREDPDKNEA